MFDIRLTVNGREVAPEEFADAMQAEVVKGTVSTIYEHLVDAVKDIECPNHSKKPSGFRYELDPDAMARGEINGTFACDPCCDVHSALIHAAVHDLSTSQ